MICRRLVACALLLVCAAGRAGERCAAPNEYRALNARVLQTRMMVAALACHAEREYNAAITALRPALRLQGERLHAYFEHAYGRAADARLDGFVTRLANEQSLLSTRDRAAFCAAGARRFAELAATTPERFDELLEDGELATAHRIKACAPPAPALAGASITPAQRLEAPAPNAR